MSKNLYQSLGLLPDASCDDIAHIIRHARKMGSVDEKILNAAEEHLLDEQKRMAYDGFLFQTSQAKSSAAVFASSHQSQSVNEKIDKKKPQSLSEPKKEPKSIPAKKAELVSAKQPVQQPDMPEEKKEIKVKVSKPPLEWTEPEIKPVIKVDENEQSAPVPVKVLCKGCARPLRARSRFCDQCGTKVEEGTQTIPVSVLVQKNAALLAIFLGGVGAHKFYLGQVKQGVIYVLFIWTLIPIILGIIDGIRLFQLSSEQFALQFEQNKLEHKISAV